MNDDLRHRLEDAGRRVVPEPEPGFADALETRLLAVAQSAQAAPEPPRRPRFAGLRLVLAGTVLAAVAVAGILVLGGPVSAPELTEPVNVEVALVDGTILGDPDGLRLPEGAVVTVGVGGFARVGDTVLEPGDVATVEQGRVRVVHDQPLGVLSPKPRETPRPTVTRKPARSPGSPSPTTGPSDAPTAAPTTAPTEAPTARPTKAPPTTEPPRPTPTPKPSRSAGEPTPSPVAELVRPRLRARAVEPAGVAITWTRTRGARTYVLLATVSRTLHARRPSYPGSRVLGEFARPPASPLRYRVPDGVVEVRLLVVALAKDGSELARSRVVRVAVGG